MQVEHGQKLLSRIRRTTVHVLQQRIVRLRKDLRRAKKKKRNANKAKDPKMDPGSEAVETADNATTEVAGPTSGEPQEQFGSELIASKDEDIAKLAQVRAPFARRAEFRSIAQICTARRLPASLKLINQKN